MVWLVEKLPMLLQAEQLPWPKLQRLLINEDIDQLRQLAESEAIVSRLGNSSLSIVDQKLGLPQSELNPPALLTGDTLNQNGFRPGPKFRLVLDSVRDAQLNGVVANVEDALEMARGILRDE